MMMFSVFKSHPKTAERIIDGAKIVIPAAKPRDNKNNAEARERTLRSNLLSRYS